MPAENRIPEPTNAVDDAIAWHDGDARRAIESLLQDREHLREQLYMARGCISRGLTRGWLPELDRLES